jgi:outer membrane scaffolding protein for murein synthesis (MipA/OmpV family)
MPPSRPLCRLPNVLSAFRRQRHDFAKKLSSLVRAIIGEIGMRGVLRGIIGASCGVALAMIAGTASAQISTLTDWQNSSGIVMRPLGGPIPDWQVTVGGGVAGLPAYEGSNEQRLSPAPTIDVRYKDLAYLSVGEGIGVNILRGTNYRAGFGLTYDMGREHNIATRLAGTGNIDPAPVFKAFAQYAFVPVVLSVDIKQALTSYQGLTANIGAYMPVVANEKVQIFVGPEVTFADSRYMQAYFGINAQNTGPQSHFRHYNANGGLKDAKFGVAGLYHFTDHWFIDGDLSVERLLGSAPGSPIVQTDWGYSVAATLNYTF